MPSEISETDKKLAVTLKMKDQYINLLFIEKAQKRLGTSGNDPRMGRSRTKGIREVLKEILQAVLLFGSEELVLTPYMGRDLGSFQHMVAWRITGRQPMRREEGG